MHKNSINSRFIPQLICGFCLLLISWAHNSFSQELEPRALTNLPVGMNFVMAGYAFAYGNTLLDPSIPVEDFNGYINTVFAAYVRSVNFFGKSGKVDVILPFGGGDWNGRFEGEPFKDHSTGFGDLRIKASVNLTGAPALKMEQFADYTQKTVSGFSVQIIIPTGSYIKEQLPNLGSNRWTFRATYGLSHSFEKWVVEGYTGIWIFTDNAKFLGDNNLHLSPLWSVKAHVVRLLNKGMWLAFGCGYGYGGRSFINDVKRNAIISAMRLGFNFSFPINQNHSLRITAVSGIRFKQGPDFDGAGIMYQYRWLRKKRNK